MPLPIVKQINDLLWALQRWQDRRWLRRRAGWWGRKRAMGRERFVWRFAVCWGLCVSIFLTGWDYLTEGDFSVLLTAMMVVLGVALGWWVGASAWADNERLYERAQQGGSAVEKSGNG